MLADERIIRAEASNKYWKTHEFDIVNCKFYDQCKETVYEAGRKEEQKIHG